MLEYGCLVWHSSLTVAQSRSLDRAQRVAMVKIIGRWEQSHTAQLQDLGLDGSNYGGSGSARGLERELPIISDIKTCLR